jgi:hypothetical protein
MTQQAEVIVRSMARIDAGHRPQRTYVLGAGMPAATEQSRARSGTQTSDAEAVIGELVNQYLRCSTNQSGIFRCW